MAIDFPSSPAEGQVHNVSPGRSFVFRSGVWVPAPLKTALPRNYIINPAMQISQQNGRTTSAQTANLDYYMADQWRCRGTAPGAWLVALTDNSWGEETRVVAVNNYGGTATVAATHYSVISHYIEGSRVADLQWGTPQAKQVILRFNWNSSLGGTYCVRISNVNETRSYITSFSGPQENITFGITKIIPGDTTGTWATDTSVGMRIEFSIAMGSTYIGVEGWQAGNFYALSTQRNGWAATGNFCGVSQVGLYADPYKTGVAPLWEPPDYATELLRCQRYWYPAYGLRGLVVGATTPNRLQAPFRTPMRITPAVTVVGSPRVYDAGATPIVTAVSTNLSNRMGVEINTTAGAGGLTIGRPAVNYWTGAADYFACNARL